MSDFQTRQEIVEEVVAYNSHLRANEEAEARYIIEAERTAANGGFSPAEDYDYRPEDESFDYEAEPERENIYLTVTGYRVFTKDECSDVGVPF